MNRLVQGDVGSGKTMIAALAMFAAAKAGFQSCMMAPTEVLARQHYETAGIVCTIGIETVMLTGSMTAAAKRKTYSRIENHEADVIIGTQALFQEKAVYDKLALIVTDEQHRFGVRQREQLASEEQWRGAACVGYERNANTENIGDHSLQRSGYFRGG